jgi:NADH-quinone oxidoreductase E subunit
MLNKEELLQIDDIKNRYPENQAALMPVLYFFQEKFGYISDESIREISLLLKIPEVNIDGVVSFYEMFHDHQKGKYLVQVCTNISCMLCNSNNILASVEKELGIKCGETTTDKQFTLEEVECLGSCGTAPVISINDRYYENMNEQKIIELFSSLR